MKTARFLGTSLLLVTTLLAGGSEAARESRISATKHNFSSSGAGTTRSTTESQICVFCHTPHGSDTSQAAPLWNKTLQNSTYTPYTSSSFDAAAIQGASAGQPLGSSKLCLSCHDGVVALGSVRVLRGQTNERQRRWQHGGSGRWSSCGTEVTGAGRHQHRLHAQPRYDLTNDHPIPSPSIPSDRDGELRRPTMGTGTGGQTLNRWGTVACGQHDSCRRCRWNQQTAWTDPVHHLPRPTFAKPASQGTSSSCGPIVCRRRSQPNLQRHSRSPARPPRQRHAGGHGNILGVLRPRQFTSCDRPTRAPRRRRAISQERRHRRRTDLRRRRPLNCHDNYARRRRPPPRCAKALMPPGTLYLGC
jgi:hypothetical protein